MFLWAGLQEEEVVSSREGERLSVSWFCCSSKEQKDANANARKGEDFELTGIPLLRDVSDAAGLFQLRSIA